MLGGLRFAGAWRHYQELALDAFEADRAAGRRHTHIVAPPGSGKTVMGLEIAAPDRRAGARARADLGDPGPVGRGAALGGGMAGPGR